MTLGIILFIGGLVAVLWLYIWSQQRLRLGNLSADEPRSFSTLTNVGDDQGTDSVMVVDENGRLLHLNAHARKLFGVGSGLPDVEFLARQITPADSFLDLLITARQAAFQYNERWLDAVSYAVPSADGRRMVVVLRESLGQSTPSNRSGLDVSRVLQTVNEIGETINASLSPQQGLQALLSIVMKAIPSDAGEISLLDAANQMMRPQGWVGDATYLLQLSEQGNGYKIGEGITGWIAQQRKPLLVSNANDPTAIKPKMNSAFKSFIGVPLLLGERLLGTFELAHRQPDRFAQADLALLLAVSKPIATAIFNGELYSRQAERVQEMATIQEVVNTAEIAQPRLVYAALHDRLSRLLKVGIVGTLLHDESRHILLPELPFHGLPDQLMNTLVMNLSAGTLAQNVWADQSYWLSNDIADDADAVNALSLRTVFEVSGVKNAALIPLDVGSQRIGMLLVANKQGGDFSSTDVRDMRLLVSQAAVVVETVRLYQREQRKETEIAGLQEITQAIGALHNKGGSFYGDVTERIARLMQIQMCGILLYNPETKTLVSQPPFFGVANELSAVYHIPVQSGSPLEEIWLESDFWYTNRVEESAVVYAAGLDTFASALGVKKTMLATMSFSGRRLGVVQISNKVNGEDFTDKDARLLLIFAAQTAAMIENARLLQDVQQSAEEANRLRTIAELASSVLTSADSPAPLLREVGLLMSSPVVYINALNREASALTVQPQWVMGVELSEPIVLDLLAVDISQSVIFTRQPFMSQNLLGAPAPIKALYGAIWGRLGLHSALTAPLAVSNRSIGEITIANRDDNTPYVAEDQALLEQVATLLITMMERLRQYDIAEYSLDRRELELDAVSAVAHELTQNLDLEPVLATICEQISHASGAAGVSVALLRPTDEWLMPNQPRLLKRIGANDLGNLTDLEREAIAHVEEPIIVYNYRTSPYEAAPREAASAVAIAFQHEGNPVGVLHLYHKRPNYFDERSIAFLGTMAAKSSLAYGNYRRYQDQVERSARLQKRVLQLNQIFELSQMLQANVDQDTLLEAILYSIQQSAGFDVGVIVLHDESEKTLRRMVQVGIPLDTFRQSQAYRLTMDDFSRLLVDDARLSQDTYFFPVHKQQGWTAAAQNILRSTSFGARNIPQTTSMLGWRDGDVLLVSLVGQGGNLLGVISLDRPHNNLRPDRNVIEILEIFAHQAASIITNTRLYLSSLENAERLATLADISSRINATLDRADVIHVTLSETARVVPYDTLTFWLRDGERLRLVGANSEEGSVNVGDGVTIPYADHARLRTVMERQRPYAIGQLVDWGRLPFEEQANSWLGIPLIGQGEVLGLLSLTKSEANFYQVRMEQAAAAFGNQVATALTNASLYTEAQYRTERLSLLNRISVGLAQAVQTETILETALREMADALGVARGRAFLFDKDTLSARAVTQWGMVQAEHPIQLLQHQPLYTIRHTAAPLLYPDVYALPNNDPARALFIAQNTRACVFIPMQVAGEVIGAFELDQSKPHTFRPEQVELATIIANQAGVAVQNARLLEQSLSRTRELQILLEVAQVTAHSPSLAELLTSGAHMFVDALGMDGCSVMLLDESKSSLKLEYAETRAGSDLTLLAGDSYPLEDYPARQMALSSQQIITVRGSHVTGDLVERREMQEHNETMRLIVPMVAQGDSKGVLIAHVLSPDRVINPAELGLAQALSTQIANALQTSHLSAKTLELAAEGYFVGSLGQAIASKLTVADISAVLLDQMPLMTEAEEQYLALYDAEKQVLHFPMALRHGDPVQLDSRPLGDDAASQVIHHHKAIIYGSTDDATYVADAGADLPSYLGLPVVYGDDVVGVLALRDSRPNFFNSDAERLWMTVSNQLGMALQNVNLFERVNKFADNLNQSVVERTEELQLERDRLDSLYQITTQLSRSLDINRVLLRALEMIAQTVNADEGAVLVLDPMTDVLHIRASLTDYGDQPHPALAFGNWALTREPSFLIDRADSHPFWNTIGETPFASALGVVLESSGDQQGVLILLSHKSGQFGSSQLKLVNAAGSQVATAINNADLYQLIREQAERLGKLLRQEQEETEKHQAILESIADGVMLADAEGTIIQFNSAAERTLGWPRNTVVGKNVIETVNLFGESGSKWERIIEQWTEDPASRKVGGFLETTIEANERVVSVHIAPVYYTDQFIGSVSVFRDITRELEVDRVKSEFVSNVSHELRTPMTSIKGYADLMLLGVTGPMTDPQRSFLEKIKTNADRLSRLVDDLLNISKIDAGDSLTLEEVNVGDILSDLVEQLRGRNQHQSKSITISTAFAAKLPIIYGDRSKISQVFNNLLDNAYNYTYSGGQITATTRYDAEREQVVIAIQDNGIGIPLDFQARIWNRFERYEDHALVMEVPGTGLGLSIVKELVQMHNGEVWFESQEGVGTTFYVALPVHQPIYK